MAKCNQFTHLPFKGLTQMEYALRLLHNAEDGVLCWLESVENTATTATMK